MDKRAPSVQPRLEQCWLENRQPSVGTPQLWWVQPLQPPREARGGEPKDTSNIIKVLSSNPIRSCMCLCQSASPSDPVVVSVAIAAAVIEAELRRVDAVYLYLGGQEERNWLTMITLWLIRLRAEAEYLPLISEPDRTEEPPDGSKASNQVKETVSKQSDYLICLIGGGETTSTASKEECSMVNGPICF